MKPVAFNRTWAVYQDDGADEGSFNGLSALGALLSIRSYKDLLSFLVHCSCRKSFAFPSETRHPAWVGETRLWQEKESVHGLTGSLDSALAKYPEIDYLDVLTANDLEQVETSTVCIAELMIFKETIKRLLTMAAIATGSYPPSGMFREIDASSIFSADRRRDSMGTNMSESKTYLLDLYDAGVEKGGIFDTWFFDESYEAETGALNLGGCILTLPEHDPWGEEGFPYYSISVTCAKDDQASIDTAKRACAGYVVKTILNHIDSIFLECSCISIPYLDEADFDKYSFDLKAGFREIKTTEPDFWFDMLLSEAVKAIVDGRVRLCQQCGEPFIVKDSRGRFEKGFCSNRCKTAASKSRRETAIRLAASCVPIEAAIMEIGDSYAKSVKTWYEEVQKANHAR